jgi:UTP--glucose-1-phosphate uridylyltransferase
MPPIRKAVFPVAGRGTRFLPATKAVPKEMLPLVDRPLIGYAVEEALKSGIEELIFVTAPGKEAIVQHFTADPDLIRDLERTGKDKLARMVEGETLSKDRIHSTIQEKALGLGHAIWCARHLVGDEPFAVILPDDVVMSEHPCIGQLINAYNRVGGNLAAVMDVPRAETASYGILDIEADDGRLARARGLVEKPAPAVAPSTLSIIGRYVLEPSIFEELDRKVVGAGGEIQITDAMAKSIAHTPFHGVRYEGIRFDCGKKEGFLEATVAFALNRRDLASTMEDILLSYTGGYRTVTDQICRTPPDSVAAGFILPCSRAVTARRQDDPMDGPARSG